MHTRRRRTPSAFPSVAVVALVAALCLPVLVPTTPVGAATGTKAKWPSLVGTWEGPYRFPSSTGAGVDSTETLVIETQDDELVWGYNQFVEANGTVTRIPLRGSIDADRTGFGLAQTGGFFVGRITGKHTMTVRFFLVGERFTAFDAKLTRRDRSS